MSTGHPVSADATSPKKKARSSPNF